MRKKIVGIFVCALLIVSSTPLFFKSTQVTAEEPNSGFIIATGDLGGRSTSGKLARTSDGTLHCVYHRSDGSYSQIYYSKSLDGGETWNEEPLTSESYDQMYPSIAVDSYDILYVVWQGCYAGSPIYSQICYRKYDGGWGAIDYITSDLDWDHRNPDVSVDGNDYLHVVFQKVDYIGGPWCPNGCGPAFYTNNIQGDWNNPDRIGEGAEYNDVFPSISIGPDNYLHVVWDAGGYRNYDCWHPAYRRNDTINWEQGKSFPCYDGFPSIAVDSAGNVHNIVKYYYGSSGILYRMRDSTDWVLEEIVQGLVPTYVAKFPSISTDSNGFLHVVWNDNGNINYCKKTTSWSDIGTIIGDTDSTAPKLIWAYHPDVNGVRTNVPKNGFAFAWNDGPIIKFYKSDDLEWDGEDQLPEVKITISFTEPIIPTESRVENGKILYESTLTITSTNIQTGNPVIGLSIEVHSDRVEDTIIQPSEPTNDRGETKARIETREKGIAEITASTNDADVSSLPTEIEFGTANYEKDFRITGYIIADENDFSGPTVTDPCGLTGTYYRTFLYSRRGVLMQGSGRTSDGRYIQIDWLLGDPQGVNTCFREVDFPTTASGDPLEPMVTIAADPNIIPLGSDVFIEGIGTRTAQDTGGAITGYCIDVYVGIGQAAMDDWENILHSTVIYLDP